MSDYNLERTVFTWPSDNYRQYMGSLSEQDYFYDLVYAKGSDSGVIEIEYHPHTRQDLKDNFHNLNLDDIPDIRSLISFVRDYDPSVIHFIYRNRHHDYNQDMTFSYQVDHSPGGQDSNILIIKSTGIYYDASNNKESPHILYSGNYYGDSPLIHTFKLDLTKGLFIGGCKDYNSCLLYTSDAADDL